MIINNARNEEIRFNAYIPIEKKNRFPLWSFGRLSIKKSNKNISVDKVNETRIFLSVIFIKP